MNKNQKDGMEGKGWQLTEVSDGDRERGVKLARGWQKGLPDTKRGGLAEA